MQNLIELLKSETESLKSMYLDMTEKWAIKEFHQMRAWCADYHAGKFKFGVASKKYYNLPHYVKSSNGKVEHHVEKSVKHAVDHYNSSIVKLAARIEKKGLTLENLKMVTSHIGVNIETTITDGEKTVRAFTIIAQGDIQRPHYRYLVK